MPSGPASLTISWKLSRTLFGVSGVPFRVENKRCSASSPAITAGRSRITSAPNAGTATTRLHHAAWAWAGSTSYKGMKLLPSHFGGTQNPMAICWPKRITPDARPRTQLHHCDDLAPTVLEILGITAPIGVNGVTQKPIDGTSFAYAIDDPDATGELHTQYFEIRGSRAIYRDGWMASARGPRLPWVPGLPPGI